MELGQKRLVVTIAVLFLLSGGTVSAGPPQSGDWVVDTTVIESDSELVLDGNLIVRDGGHLTLSNVTLRIKEGLGGSYGILVANGCKLTLVKSTVISDSTGKGYTFVVEGELDATDSRIEGLLGEGGGKEEGLVVKEGTLTLTRTTISSARGTALFLNEADATLEDSVIDGNGGSGVLITGISSPRLVRTNITNNGEFGVLVQGMASPELLDCLISDNGRDGASIDGGSGSFTGNRLQNNGGHGVSSKDSSTGVSFNGDTIIGNSGWGVTSQRGAMTLKGVVFEQGGRTNSLGRTSQAWGLTVGVEDIDGNPKVDAEVKVTSKNGVDHGPILTDGMGLAYFENLVASQLWNNGSTWNENPYTIRVDVKEDGQTLTSFLEMNLTDNSDVKVLVDFADLALSNLYVAEERVTKGDEVEVSVMVSNIGGKDSGGFSVTFFDGAKAIGTKRMDALVKGTSQEVTMKWRTSDAASGKHTIRAVVDLKDEVLERDESNNELSVKAEVEESAILVYAIPILIVVGVVGLLGFKVYTWVLMKRLEKKQKEKKEEETVDFTVVEEDLEKEEE